MQLLAVPRFPEMFVGNTGIIAHVYGMYDFQKSQ